MYRKGAQLIFQFFGFFCLIIFIILWAVVMDTKTKNLAEQDE